MLKTVQILLVYLSPNLVFRVFTSAPVLISLMLALLSTATAQTSNVINIDLTQGASTYNPSAHRVPGVIGKSSEVTWNAIGDTVSHDGLLDENGVVTGVSFQLTGNLVETQIENDNVDTFRFGGTGSAVNGFFQSFAFLSDNGDPGNADTSTFTIGGLEAASSVNLFCYSTWGWADTGAEFRISSDGGASWSAWKLADGSPSDDTAPFSVGHSYVVFSNVSVHSDGTILGEWKTTLSGGSTRNRGPFNAIQIWVFRQICG